VCTERIREITSAEIKAMYGAAVDFQLFSSRFVDGEEELQPVTMAPLSRRETLAAVRKAAEDSKEDLQLNSVPFPVALLFVPVSYR
jgi:hypothetical protein